MAGIPEKAKRDTLNLRIQPELRGLIDHARELTGQSRTDFVLDAARRKAEETLLDQTLFVVKPEVYAAFIARLDAPARPNERLCRTLETPAPWEK